MREDKDHIRIQRFSTKPVTYTHKNNYTKGKTFCGIIYHRGSKTGQLGDKINVKNPKRSTLDYM